MSDTTLGVSTVVDDPADEAYCRLLDRVKAEMGEDVWFTLDNIVGIRLSREHDRAHGCTDCDIAVAFKITEASR